MSLPSRADTLALVESWTASESLRKHMLSVEAAMRVYAERAGENPDHWGTAGLVHDFDYERFPNNERFPDREHPSEGVRQLRSLGYPEDICEAVLGHADYTGVPRTTAMAKTLFAVDELTGLITACALVKPSRSLKDVDVSGIRKKMKDKAFARGVNRDDIVNGAASIDVPLDEHIAIVLGAMREIAPTLGLAGAFSAEGTGSTPVNGGA
jgi:putative nucleotidyltransferase with HDIG domain